MPNRDGTGPAGQGPAAGRGRGPCGGKGTGQGLGRGRRGRRFSGQNRPQSQEE